MLLQGANGGDVQVRVELAVGERPRVVDVDALAEKPLLQSSFVA